MKIEFRVDTAEVIVVSESSSPGDKAYEVDEVTYKRWKSVMDQWDKVQEEMAQFIDETEEGNRV